MFSAPLDIQSNQIQVFSHQMIYEVVIEPWIPRLGLLHNLSSHSFLHKVTISLEFSGIEKGFIQGELCPVIKVFVSCKNLFGDHAVAKSKEKNLMLKVITNILQITDLKAAVENSLLILGSMESS